MAIIGTPVQCNVLVRFTHSDAVILA